MGVVRVNLRPFFRWKGNSMKRKRFLSAILAIVSVMCLCIPTFAADSTTATVPVTLTVENKYRAVNVTVPAALPVYVINGTVVTADDVKIINNSKTTAVQVTDVEVTNGSFSVGDYDNFSGSSKIALKINGCPTKGAGKMYINTTAFPRIEADSSMPLEYYAKVSGDAKNAEKVNAANVVFTISIKD